MSELEVERDYYKSLVESFFSGEVPIPGSLQHFIMAKYGRLRLDSISKVPRLLESSN